MLLTLVAASLLGSLAAALLLAAGRADWQSKLPLGTFLATAAIPVSLVGDAVVAWYLSFYP
jgi:prepilin signal peptidase PulO-like enzyme (type II secretory pathway)